MGHRDRAIWYNMFIVYLLKNRKKWLLEKGNSPNISKPVLKPAWNYNVTSFPMIPRHSRDRPRCWHFPGVPSTCHVTRSDIADDRWLSKKNVMPWKYALCVPKLWTFYGRGFLNTGVMIVDDRQIIARWWLWWVEMGVHTVILLADVFGHFYGKHLMSDSEPGSQEAAKWRCRGWESIRSWSLNRAAGWFDMIFVCSQSFQPRFFFADVCPMSQRSFWAQAPQVVKLCDARCQQKSDYSRMVNLGWKSIWNSIKFALVALSCPSLVACWDQCFPLIWINWCDLDWRCDNYRL